METHTPQTNDEHEVRIALLLPARQRLLSLDATRPTLIVGKRQGKETTESAAHRTIAEISEQRTLALPRFKTYLGLGVVDGVVGFSLAPASEGAINLRQFRIRADDFTAISEQLDRDAEYFNPSDVEFLGRAIKRRPRHIS